MTDDRITQIENDLKNIKQSIQTLREELNMLLMEHKCHKPIILPEYIISTHTPTFDDIRYDVDCDSEWKTFCKYNNITCDE